MGHERELMQAEQLLWDKIAEMNRTGRADVHDMKNAFCALKEIECLKEKSKGYGDWILSKRYERRDDQKHGYDDLEEALERMRAETRSQESKDMIDKMISILRK